MACTFCLRGLLYPQFLRCQFGISKTLPLSVENKSLQGTFSHYASLHDSMPPFQPDTTSPNHSPALLAYLWLYISDFFLFIIQCKRRPRICVQSPVPFRSIPQLSPFSFAAQDFIFYTADRVDEFAILREINIIIFLTWCDFWKAGIVSYM